MTDEVTQPEGGGRQEGPLLHGLQYQDRIVAFLDILGWRAAVSRSAHDPEYARSLGVALAELRSHAELAEMSAAQGLPMDLQFSQFSDSIVISVAVNELGRTEGDILWPLRRVVERLVSNGLLFRGGVSRGQMAHHGSVAYGPALTAAYDLEQTAEFPRIVLDQALTELWGRGTPMFDRTGNFIEMWREWRCAPDGLYFYDWLRPPFPLAPDALLEERIERLRTLVLSYGSADLPVAIIGKYRWLAGYINRVIRERRLVGVEPFEHPFRSRHGRGKMAHQAQGDRPASSTTSVG